MEPYDESLANRVSVLSDEVDELTERVVDCRKNIPAAYSEAVQKRSSALNKLINGREEQRRKRLRARKQRLFFPALAKGEPLAGKLFILTNSRRRREKPRERHCANCANATQAALYCT